ncbi:MAG: hypothetical protein ABSC56_09325 [Solirubrobacteraceae bacterium]
MNESYSFSFADQRAGAYCCGSGGLALVVAGREGSVAAELAGEGPFAVRGPEVGEVALEPLGEGVTFDDGGPRRWACRARGKDARGAKIDGYGSVALGPTELAGTALLRNLWVCFGDELAISVLARRRAAQDEHGDEELAVVVGRGAPLALSLVADPRLSSTYGEDGHVLRAGLELWEDELEGERERGRALRLAGETLAVGELEGARVAFMVWRYGGREGIGCYTIERAAS